jgi:hypothetical protein
MKKILAYLIPFLALASYVNAVCPVCTVAVGIGVGVLREWGVDDLITGIWFGALIISSAAWFINWLNKKHIKFNMKEMIIVISFYLIFIVPLYFMKIMGLPGNTILGIDKIGFGVIIGSILFVLAVQSDGYMRKINEGKIFMPYQKVAIPMAYLAIISIITYLILRLIS